MGPFLSTIPGILVRIRTPLTLAGLVVLILYALYRQVLNLQIFSQVNSDQTFALIDTIVRSVFWLALVALVLGILSYVISILLRHKYPGMNSDVEIIDQRVDPNMTEQPDQRPSSESRLLMGELLPFVAPGRLFRHRHYLRAPRPLH